MSLKEKGTQYFYFQIAKYTSTKHLLWLNRLLLLLTISVYDYKDIWPSSVVYIFHKGIIVYCVALKYKWICKALILSESPPLISSGY